MPAPIYDLDDIMRFSRLHDRTNEAAEELEAALMKILEDHKLNKHEVMYTLARVVDSFIRMEEDFCFDEDKRMDAEAAFNDYFLQCRDIGDDDHDGEAHIIGPQEN